MMNNILTYITLVILSVFSGAAVAHVGHDHSMIYAAGQAHPVLGLGEMLLLSLTVSAVYLILRLIRK